MASFADAINALVAERDRQFVERIATEYSLDLAELTAKYLETAAAAIKIPRKYKKREPKEVKVTVVDGEKPVKAPKAPKAPKEKTCCTAQTSKKEPCKFSALKGEVFCLRHLKASQTTENPEEPKPPKAKKPAKKAEQPVHNHPLSDAVADDCELCQSHGNPLVESQDFEVAGPEVTVQDRLAAMLEAAEESEVEVEFEAESDSEEPSSGGAESEYEDE
jgi:hypothetical protein